MQCRGSKIKVLRGGQDQEPSYFSLYSSLSDPMSSTPQFDSSWNQRRQSRAHRQYQRGYNLTIPFPGVVPITMIRNQPQQTPQGTGGNFRQPMASGPPTATQRNYPGTYNSQTQDRGVRSLYYCCPWGLNGNCCGSTTSMSTRNQ